MNNFTIDILNFFKTLIPVKTEIELGACFATVGTICNHLFGSWSNLWEAILLLMVLDLSLIHISEPTRHMHVSRMPSSA